MDIGSIDASATLGRSWLHAASPVAKLVAFALVLAAVIVNWNVLVVGSLTLLLAAAVASAGLKFRLAFGLAAYPAVFALVFALASAPDAMTGTVIVLKAASAGLAAVTVALTTPYPQVFAPLQRVVPSIVGDAMLMTYRSTFLLLEKFSNLLTAVRLRSGVSARQPVRAGRATAQALGGLLLYSFDLSQRDYDIMRLRGYQDRIRSKPARSERPLADITVVALAVLALATSTLWRLRADALNPYSWLVPIVPALVLLAAIVLGRRSDR